MIDMDMDESFFDDLDIPYSEFISYSIRDKMVHVRKHVKARISEHENYGGLMKKAIYVTDASSTLSATSV